MAEYYASETCAGNCAVLPYNTRPSIEDALRFCLVQTQICRGKTPSDFKRMIFQVIFGPPDADGPAPVKDGEPKSAERAPFEACSYRYRLLTLTGEITFCFEHSFSSAAHALRGVFDKKDGGCSQCH